MTDVAMYEARSEGQQKQAEMWVLGCQPNSAPNKAIHPLPYQPHSTHISDVCLCDGQLLRDSKRYLREVQTSAVSSVNVQAPFRIYPRSHSSSPRLPPTNSTLPLSPQSCPLFPFCLSGSPCSLSPKVFVFAIFSALNTLPRDPSVQFSSVAQSCPTLCDPMNRSMPGLPVHHQLPEFTQTHGH